VKEPQLARSSTSFGGPRGNKPAAVPGNTLAVVHGATSATVIEPRVPAKIAQLYEQMPWLIECDREGVKSFARVCIQEDLLDEYLEEDGGRGKLFTRDGVPRKVSVLWKEIQLAKREWMKILAIGPGPRSQYAQAMSGVGKNMIDVRRGLRDLHQEIATEATASKG
jgi:hypothetical protein